MSKIIHIFNEVTLETSVITVSNKDYKTLQKLEFCGGFKRFGLSIYDEIKNLKTETNKLIQCLNDIFANKELIKTYF